MKKICLIIAVLFLFSSCKKDNDNKHVMDGVVLDYTTGARIPSASVMLYSAAYVDISSPAGLMNPSLVSGFSNNSGKFSFELPNNNDNRFYTFIAAKSGFFFIREIMAKSTTGRNSDQPDTLYLDKHSILNLTVNNLIPASPTDSIDISISHMRTFIPGIMDYIAKRTTLVGNINNHVIRDTFSLKQYPMLKVSWVVRNNGTISTNEQVLSPVEFSTTNFNLNY